LTSPFPFIRTADGTFIAHDPKTGLAASGRNVDQAVAELRRLLSERRTAA
jgi:hypothetical protein